MSFQSDAYQPAAFYFSVRFSATGELSDTSFQEVSGISSELETESYTEAGENRFTYLLPTAVKHTRLILKRGIANMTSPLVQWCRAVMDDELAQPIQTMSILVSLMNEDEIPIRTWSFIDAYPIKWTVDPFNSTKNAVAIETIELFYKYLDRLK